MHKKIIMACMAIAAFAAFVAPSASATNLKENGTTLAVGASVTGKNVGETKFTAGNLTVSCTTAHMTGTITVDAGGVVEGEIPALNPHFTGTGAGGDCTSALGDVNPTVNTKLCLKVSNSDSGQVTGCGGNLTFSLEVTGVVTCKYQAAGIVGEITTAPKDAEVNIVEREAVEEGGLFLCPDSGKLDMEFVLTTTNAATLQFTT